MPAPSPSPCSGYQHTQENEEGSGVAGGFSQEAACCWASRAHTSNQCPQRTGLLRAGEDEASSRPRQGPAPTATAACAPALHTRTRASWGRCSLVPRADTTLPRLRAAWAPRAPVELHKHSSRGERILSGPLAPWTVDLGLHTSFQAISLQPEVQNSKEERAGLACCLQPHRHTQEPAGAPHPPHPGDSQGLRTDWGCGGPTAGDTPG